MDQLRGGGEEHRSMGQLAARYEVGDEESPSLALVRVLATLNGVEETEMETLYEHADLEALDAFLDSTEDTPYWSGSVQLEMDDSVVFVDDETVVVMADPAPDGDWE